MTDKIIKAEQYVGLVTLAGREIPCAVLPPDGTRVLSQRGVGSALGRARGGLYSRQSTSEDGGEKLPFFLSALALRPFIEKELLVALENPIPYRHGKGGGIALGIPATALPQVCDVWLKAREAGALNKPQLAVAQRAEMLMRGLAHVGIIALVDEATGYQEVRDKLALQQILDKYLLKEFAAWAKRFPNEFYREMFRLRGWQWRGMKVNRPSVVGKYTNDLVWNRLAPGVLDELQRRNPKDEKGNRKSRHHQWLTEEIGIPALSQHLFATVGFMRAAANWDQFYRMMQRAFPKLNSTLYLNFPDPESEGDPPSA
jgi:hypothetical protein